MPLSEHPTAVALLVCVAHCNARKGGLHTIHTNAQWIWTYQYKQILKLCKMRLRVSKLLIMGGVLLCVQRYLTWIFFKETAREPVREPVRGAVRGLASLPTLPTALPTALPTPLPTPLPTALPTALHTMVVLVLSRRDVFETRQVIRDTWAKGHANVFFVLGTCCPIPPSFRKQWTCEQARVPSDKEQKTWDAQCHSTDKRLSGEQADHGDLVRISEVDVYRHLPQKVKAAYAWAVEHTSARWFVKTDDDSVVRVDTLEHYLATTYDAEKPVVVGSISKGWGVPKSGKWAELSYPKSKYPNFPLGSNGHVVSHPVASYLVEHRETLFNYQGEDVSIGIWLDESPLRDNVQWVSSKHIANHGNCKDPDMWMIGHNIKTATMKDCFKHMDEAAHVPSVNIDASVRAPQGSPMVNLPPGELPGTDWLCHSTGNGSYANETLQWLRSHAVAGRTRILFLGDSVTMQWPRSIVCALKGLPRLTLKTGNVRRYTGLQWNDTLQSVRDRGLSPWYNDAAVAPPPWPKVPFVEDWRIEECNCTIGHALTYTVMTTGIGEVKSLNVAAIRHLLENYDLVVFGMGYHYKRANSQRLAAAYDQVSAVLSQWKSEVSHRQVFLHELFPQHFKCPSGLYEDMRGSSEKGCGPLTYRSYVQNDGNWRNDVIRKHANRLPILPTVQLSTPWMHLKQHERHDCTHWKPSSELVLPLLYMDEAAHVKKGVSRWETVQMNPLDLDIKNRFDIVVKTVYAIFLRRGNVPVFVTDMYNRHLEVWNQFKEACSFAWGKDWFDTTKPCVKKSSAADFQRSFAKTLDSIAKDGFDTTRSLVPVTRMGFPLNGAHRIAAAIALGLPTMPVQRVASKAVYTWDRTFFTGKGFETKYADFAMLQWTLHVSNVSTIMFWPEAASKPDTMKVARVLVTQHCGDVLYEKSIDVNRNGVASLAFHAYGNQGWLLEKIKQLQSIYNGADDEQHSITVVFVRPQDRSHLKACKDKLRSHFALSQPKSSVHIPDYHEESVLVAEMVLNPNSVVFLNRHDGDNCREVAKEVATRLHLTAVNPESFVLPQDLMVDSGAVMSFFGLRKRTDVDLLFQVDVDESILGNRHGILVEAHAFEHNVQNAGRAWGTEHLVDCTAQDLFADPRYYGYCHGMKYVSLEQLIRYKQRRGEPNKDDEDVSKMKRFVGRVREPQPKGSLSEGRSLIDNTDEEKNMAFESNRCRWKDWHGPCSNRGDLADCTAPPGKQLCVCNNQWGGPSCSDRKTLVTAHLSKNLKKYKGYTELYCGKKLSMSGLYTDDDLIKQIRDYINVDGVSPNRSSPLTIFDACMGCGGFGSIMNQNNIPIRYDGNDLSTDAIEWVGGNVPGVGKLWAVDASMGFNFILDNVYDLSLSWFCLNNIAENSLDKKEAACILANDLIRVTKPGGIVWLGMYYESDCPGLGNHFPLNFFIGGVGGCTLQGGKVEQHHTLKERYGLTKYCGTMKSTWVRVESATVSTIDENTAKGLPIGNTESASWPPVLFSTSNIYALPDVETLNCLLSVVRASNTNPSDNCLALYIQSGASLAKYRQGGPFRSDNDIDVRVVRNAKCAAAVYQALPSHLAACKRSGTMVALNSYDKWGDVVANLTQHQDGPPYPSVDHTTMAALLSTLTLTNLDSTNNVSFFIRKPHYLLDDLRREYGPAWFVPSPNHGITTAVIKLGPRNKRVRDYLCREAPGVNDVSSLDTLMNRLGASNHAYAHISQFERCKAAKWMAWMERFCRGEVEVPSSYSGHFPTGLTEWAFPECDNFFSTPMATLLGR